MRAPGVMGRCSHCSEGVAADCDWEGSVGPLVERSDSNLQCDNAAVVVIVKLGRRE